ncbi:hypothetical protein [Acinetobacter boissieri]|uniref:Uncharacterized protein n=1 Tax=Acinetobacter boissieri TaxID=1219383 RepID=A0A1G6H024_9GAMM|nr:hypothetical protein [Acinetobacter boissieri]SDB87609.1 hypothetical protein SAMN05421733_103101 [Acinetobacter boissieri]
MKQLLILSVLLLGSMSVLADEPSATTKSKVTQPDGDITIVQRPVISGLWGMAMPNSQCVEYYNFKDNNKVVVNSNQEWSTGLYEYQPSVDNGPVSGLALQITSNNSQPDCSGKTTPVNNEVLQYYVHWQDANNIQFCGSADSRSCVVGLRRILP